MENKFTAEEMYDFALWFSRNKGQFADDESTMKDYLEMWGLEKLVEKSSRIPIIRG